MTVTSSKKPGAKRMVKEILFCLLLTVSLFTCFFRRGAAVYWLLAKYGS